jgi:hypothetical protein
VSGQLVPWQYYPQGKRPSYTLHRRQGGCRAGRHLKVEKNLLMLLGMKQLKYNMNIIALIMVMLYILQFGGESGHLI